MKQLLSIIHYFSPLLPSPRKWKRSFKIKNTCVGFLQAAGFLVLSWILNVFPVKELGNGGEEAGFQDPMQGASFLFPLKQPDCCVSHHHKPCPGDPESGEQEVQPSVETWVGGIGGRSEEGPGGWGAVVLLSYALLRFTAELHAWHLSHCPQHSPEGPVGSTLEAGARRFPSSPAASANLSWDLCQRATHISFLQGYMLLIPGTKSRPSPVCSHYLLGLFD